MTDGCLVDTDIVSYLFRRDTRAERFRPFLSGKLLALSFMTIAELDRWMLQRNWAPARQAQLAAMLTNFTIVLVNRSLCRTWAEVSDQAPRDGHPIQSADAWIAATAIALDIPLLTNNRADFAHILGLRLLP